MNLLQYHALSLTLTHTLLLWLLRLRRLLLLLRLCCCFSFPWHSAAPPNQPPWLLTLPSHPFHVLCALVLAPKNDAKFSSNEKQAFSAGDRHFSLLPPLRCCCRWWWKVKINQPNHPNTHPPLATTQRMQLHCQQRCKRRSDVCRSSSSSSGDQSTHQQQKRTKRNETCAPACLCVCMFALPVVRVCVCVL